MYAIQNNFSFLGLYKLVNDCTSPPVEHIPHVDGGRGGKGGEGGEGNPQWEAGIWSCDLRANERHQKN